MRRLPIACAVLLAAATAHAQMPDPFRPAASADPMRAASLAMEPALATIPAPRAWQAAVEIGYFNLWDVSPDVVQAHVGGRAPVTSAELRAAEQAHPGADPWLLDVEGWRTDFFLSRGLAPGLAVTVHVPWIEIGTPRWDGVAERWHSLTGLPNGDRDRFPRDALLVYVHGDGTIERRDLRGAGIGDTTVALAATAGRWAGAEHRVTLEVEAPTGARDGLRGSGGWDTGVRWYATWRGERSTLLAGAGYSWLATSGSLLGVRRHDTWHLVTGLDLHLWRHLTAYGRALYEQSPLAGFTRADPGDPALALRFGVAAPVGDQGWVSLGMGQNWPGLGTAPDYSFHLTYGIGRTR